MIEVGVLIILSALVLIGLPWLLAIIIPVFLLLALPLGFVSLLSLSARYRRAQEEAERHRLRVLVVDDDEISVTPLLTALAKKATSIDFVKSGGQMVEALREKTYDLIFLDYLMPDISGEEALKVSEKYLSLSKSVPVIFFTGYHKNFLLPKLKQFEIRGVWDKTAPFRVLNERLDLLNNQLVMP